jgi:hypothetical protein
MVPWFSVSLVLVWTVILVVCIIMIMRQIMTIDRPLTNNTTNTPHSAPTFLDALLFAYLHRLLASNHDVRVEVTRRINLVAWERKVASLVRGAFTKYNGSEGLSA